MVPATWSMFNRHLSFTWMNESVKSMKWINEIEWRPDEIFLFPLVFWWLVHTVVVETCLPTQWVLLLSLNLFWAKFGETLNCLPWWMWLFAALASCRTWGFWEPASFVASLQVGICFPLIFLFCPIYSLAFAPHLLSLEFSLHLDLY